MADIDLISLSSKESSRPSSPFIDISEVLNDSEKLNEQKAYSFHDYVNTGINIEKYDSPIIDSSPSKSRVVHTLSESDSDAEVEFTGSNTIGSEKLPNFEDEYSRNHKNSRDIGTAQYTMQEKSVPLKKQDNEKSKKCYPKTKTKLSKEEKLEEKLIKQRENEKKKAEKQAARELQKQMKPGNCMKNMTVIVDSNLVTCSFGGTLISAIQNSEAKCNVAPQDVPLTISWIRDSPGSVAQEENDLVLIWQWQVVIPAIKTHTMCSLIDDIQAQHPLKSISLVVFGLNGYFSYLKSKRKHSAVPSKAKKGKRSSDTEEFPYVTRKDIEEELIELQIRSNCNHRLIESSEDLGQLILYITKAVAERPFKLEKQKKELESLEWFAAGDSRDCVPVDKNGNGLMRLWQQQLCQFNLAGHDVAQAIAAIYPSPSSLVQAYEKCGTQKESEELLKDIQVRRCQGPLSSSRRIGPELSRKVYMFFQSIDGDASLSQEQ